MSFLKNSTGLVKFICKEIPKDIDYRDVYIQEMIRYSFRSIEDDSDIERSVGWVDLFQNEDIPSKEEVFKGDFLTFSMRIDTKKVPASAHRSLCKKLLIEKRQQNPQEKITKEVHQEIKEIAKSLLLKKVIPSTKVYDVIWNIKKNNIWFSGTSDKLVQEFICLFENTFHLTLTPLFPFNLATFVISPNSKLEDLLSLTETFFN